jgi:DNA-binding SARP family transcriptional activator
MTVLRVKLLGSPEIYRDGERIVGFTYQKSLALFSYLIVTRQSHSRLSLATLLWGESSDSNARAQLRTALAELRQHLEPYLSVTRKTVAFNSEPDYWLDVDVFTSSCQSLQAEANSMADIERLKKAVDLYRGDFLEGFYVRNAVDFEQWQREQQEWLHKLVEQALRTLVEDTLLRGTADSFTEGLVYVNRLLALTPWYEQAHRQKMRLLGLKGQRSEALAQYQRCVDILAEQFGAEPAAETTELFEQIKNDQLSPPSPKTTSATPPHNLPAPVISFIGRKLELAELAKLLRNPDHRFITLVGEGGVGKTHLAQVAARQVLADFPDGVWFVPLLNLQPSASATPEMWPDMLATAIADAWGFRFYGQESPQHQLFNRLHSKNALLVLDNFEHLLPGGEFVLNLLKSAPGITVLVTSRARLKFRAEHALRLEGLPLPPTDSDPTAADYSSVQLFWDRARRASASFTVDDDTLPQVVRLCRFVEGLPLGIELISAWVEHLTLAEIIANLEQNLDFAAATYQDVPERHHCLRVVFVAVAGPGRAAASGGPVRLSRQFQP